MSSTFNDGVNTFFRRKSDHEGVKISFNDEGAISVTLYIVHSIWISYSGCGLTFTRTYKTALVSYTEIEVQTIDVVVQDIIFDDLVTPSTALGGYLYEFRQSIKLWIRYGYH